ncbi:hypothetical protein L0156_20950, partial [bacterium]|nr:hypothetical protein [bacterium]
GVVFPKENRSFDPTKIADAIKKAGFSAPRIEIIVKGVVEGSKDGFALRVLGQPRNFILQGGAKFMEFQKAFSVGEEAHISGTLQESKDNSPPKLSVENFDQTRSQQTLKK